MDVLTKKQRIVLAMAKHRPVSALDVRRIYNSIRYGRNALEKLVAFGYLKHSELLGRFEITEKGEQALLGYDI